MGRLDETKLRKAGFVLEKYEDGMFWVLEKVPGPDSQRLLATCRLCITGFEEAAFQEDFVLQCDFDCSDPALFLDGFVWRLSPRDFASIVRCLGRMQKEKSVSK